MARHPAETTVAKTSTFSTRIPVLIKVDMTSAIPRVIWAHEKPILEEIHGEDNVQEIPFEKLDEGFSAKVSPTMLMYNKKQDKILPPSETLGLGFVFLGAPDVEYGRLGEAYGKHTHDNVSNVEKVYGRLQTGHFARLIGNPKLSDLPDQQLRFLIGDYGYPEDVNPNSTQAEKAEHAQRVRDLRELKTDGLLVLAEKLNVEI